MTRRLPTILVGLLALTVAACSGSPAPAAPGSATAGAVVASPIAATTSPVTTVAATPAATPETTPEPTPTAFTSAAYGYDLTFPAGDLQYAPTAVSTPWDGASRIDSTGPNTDYFYRPGSRLLFVYGAPTDLALDAYAAAGQRLKHDWHDCPVTPESTAKATLGGTPALLYSFECGGARVFSLYVVRDGMGLVVNQITPPGNEAADQAELLRLLEGWSWTG